MALQIQRNSRAPPISQLNTTIDRNRSRISNQNMFAVQGIAPYQRNPPVTNDQYHHRETIWRILFDVISLIILIIVTIISHYVAKPFIRGFFCSDTSIQYPYKGNTIPTSAAVILSIGLPLLWIFVTEFSKVFYFRRYPKQAFVTRLELCGKRIFNVSPFFRNLYILIVVFFYGYLATWLLTEIAKNFVGALRPHFLAVCQPTFNCSLVTSLSQFNRYLQFGIDYTCQNSDDSAVREARRSFFSGHSSSIFYGMAWLIMYIHVSWSWRHLGILGHLFQVGFAVLAFYISYSRLSDFQHHWQDVFVGGLVGSLIAFVAFKFILNWHHYSTRFLPHIAPSRANTSISYPRRLNGYYESESMRYF